VKSLVAVSKKSGRGWGKIRVALLRCDSERSAGYLPPQKEGWYIPRGRGGHAHEIQQKKLEVKSEEHETSRAIWRFDVIVVILTQWLTLSR